MQKGMMEKTKWMYFLIDDDLLEKITLSGLKSALI